MKPQAIKALQGKTQTEVKELISKPCLSWMIRVAKRSRLVPVADIQKREKLVSLLVNHRRFADKAEARFLRESHEYFVKAFIHHFAK